MNFRFLLSLLFCLITVLAYTQPSYDNCNTPQKIDKIQKYCSKVGEFNNINATPSGYSQATCWVGTSNDVWFSFKAFASDISVTIIGTNRLASPASPGGTLRSIQAALYSGICGGTIAELNCSIDSKAEGILALYEGGLVVGQDYLLRVDGVNGATGTFQLCLNNYFPPAQVEQDCNNATVICNNEPFVTQSVRGCGVNCNEAAGSCLGEGNSSSTSETQSTWYSWIASVDCKLTFVLTPLNPADDIDFAVYELPSGIHNCSDKKLLRCNATAPPCAGPTGLSLTANDTVENFNCNPGEDGFSKYIDMVAGRAYTICINNFTNSGIGFSMDWGGCDFIGPTAAFDVNPRFGLKCETTFTVTDSSFFPSGNIKSRVWNFGKDASPATSTSIGPHAVNYYSFGEKYITLTIETELGCKVTQVLRIDVEPCCEDLPTLKLLIDSIVDLTCFQSNDGRVVFRGMDGTPYIDADSKEKFYQFSLDGINFAPLKNLTNLAAGTYRLYIQDAHGCTNSIEITINEPPPVVVTPSVDFSKIELGDEVVFSANAQPNNTYTYQWRNRDSIICQDCSFFKDRPYNSGYYVVTATDQNGCIGIDSISVEVIKNYTVHVPNVFSPNRDVINDFFNVIDSKGLAGVDLLQIYDRWGGLIFSSKNINVNDTKSGWDGKSKNKLVNPGVYVYLIQARFIDGTIKTVSGDVTLLL